MLDTIFLGASAFFEFLVAGVIFYEWEGGRLDRFLEDTDRLTIQRQRIYRAYCGLKDSGAKGRGDAFKRLLETPGNEELLEDCLENIRLLSRIGARLPKTWLIKKTPIEWHVAAILWTILSSFVEGKRKEVGPSYANNFLAYARVSTKELLGQKRNKWTLRDPDTVRRCDVIFTREEMSATEAELKESLEREW
jgi:hypothetical protein